MRNWSSIAAWARYMRLEGFLVGTGLCAACGHRQSCAIEPRTDPKTLQCARCGKPATAFTEGGEEQP